MIRPEAILLEFFLLGLHLDHSDGFTYGMFEDGQFYVVSTKEDTEKRYGIEMTMAWFFELARSLSNEKLLEMKSDIVLYDLRRSWSNA